MKCCGQVATRAITRSQQARIRYEGGPPVVVAGPATGRAYRFSGTDRVQLVDPRDAPGLARGGMFRLIGVVETTGD
ncbi:hypothetical protein [Aquisphaera giovannonii]|uniref:hypothetical protein n=1 Tax=Aquisphaera giovannonii TaxID=406548 RepID=UPI0011E01B5F|nr:hypothetical protein [Aquisphaera giovannonii]